MKTRTTLIAILLLIAALVCSCATESREAAMSAEAARTVTDLGGNTVQIPTSITGMASNSASVTTHIVMVCGVDAVKIAPASFQTGHTEEFEEFFVETDRIPLADGNRISAEKLLSSGVNVFFTTKQEEADEYSAAGLTCVVLNYDTLENIAKTFQVIGHVFGGVAEKKGDAIGQNILKSKTLVEETIGNVPDSESTTVYYLSASTQTTPYITQGKGTSIDALIAVCGATLVSPGKGLDVQVNPEYLLNTDPDYILIDGYLAKEACEELLNDPTLKNLNAIKDNHIVIAPVGFFRPLLRPGAESGIGLLWLAETFGNGKIEESLLEEYALSLYNDCFDFQFSEQNVHSMLHWADGK